MLTDAPEGKTMHKEPGVKTFEQTKVCTFVLFLPKCHIFAFSTALQKLLNMLACFQEDKIREMYPSHIKSLPGS